MPISRIELINLIATRFKELPQKLDRFQSLLISGRERFSDNPFILGWLAGLEFISSKQITAEKKRALNGLESKIYQIFIEMLKENGNKAIEKDALIERMELDYSKKEVENTLAILIEGNYIFASNGLLQIV